MVKIKIPFCGAGQNLVPHTISNKNEKYIKVNGNNVKQKKREVSKRSRFKNLF